MSEVQETDLLLLCAYLDKELEGEELAQLEQRLKTEPALAAELEELRVTMTVVSDLDVPEVSPQFTDIVRRRIRRRSRGRYFATGSGAADSLTWSAWALLIVLGIAATLSMMMPEALNLTSHAPLESEDSPPEESLPDGRPLESEDSSLDERPLELEDSPPEEEL